MFRQRLSKGGDVTYNDSRAAYASERGLNRGNVGLVGIQAILDGATLLRQLLSIAAPRRFGAVDRTPADRQIVDEPGLRAD